METIELVRKNRLKENENGHTDNENRRNENRHKDNEKDIKIMKIDFTQTTLSEEAGRALSANEPRN